MVKIGDLISNKDRLLEMIRQEGMRQIQEEQQELVQEELPVPDEPRNQSRREKYGRRKRDG